jgi:hypothetical protein
MQSFEVQEVDALVLSTVYCAGRGKGPKGPSSGGKGSKGPSSGGKGSKGPSSGGKGSKGPSSGGKGPKEMRMSSRLRSVRAAAV